MNKLSLSALLVFTVIGCGNADLDMEDDSNGHYSDDVEPADTDDVAQKELAISSGDAFECFAVGKCSVPLASSKYCKKDRDYSTSVTERSGDVVVVSIHGGLIEPLSSEVADTMASKYGWSRYDFDAHGTSTCLGKLSNFDKLHITATGFDDPQAVNLVSRYKKAVAIHGYDDSRGNKKGTICVGGANSTQIQAFISAVNQNKSRFTGYSLNAVNAASGKVGAGADCTGLTGTARLNLVNRVAGGQGGLQLEMSNAIKADLQNGSTQFSELRNVFYGAVRSAMSK